MFQSGGLLVGNSRGNATTDDANRIGSMASEIEILQSGQRVWDDRRTAGRVRFFNVARGCGMILSDEGEDLFAHRTHVDGLNIIEGDVVELNRAWDSRNQRSHALTVTGGTGAGDDDRAAAGGGAAAVTAATAGGDDRAAAATPAAAGVQYDREQGRSLNDPGSELASRAVTANIPG